MINNPYIDVQNPSKPVVLTYVTFLIDLQRSESVDGVCQLRKGGDL